MTFGFTLYADDETIATGLTDALAERASNPASGHAQDFAIGGFDGVRRGAREKAVVMSLPCELGIKPINV